MDDLISRQAAIEKLDMLFREDKAQSVTHYNHGVADAMAIIKNLPTADVPEKRVGKWIPCKEGLPKNSEPVLVTLADGEVTTDEYWGDAVYPEDEGWGLQTLGVVAWMPLPEPEPYREEAKHEDH